MAPPVKSPEAHLQMAMAALGLAFARVLVARDASLLRPLQTAIEDQYHMLKNRGDEEAAIPLGVLSRALHEKDAFG
jgi:hypothetical protein